MLCGISECIEMHFQFNKLLYNEHFIEHNSSTRLNCMLLCIVFVCVYILNGKRAKTQIVKWRLLSLQTSRSNTLYLFADASNANANAFLLRTNSKLVVNSNYICCVESIDLHRCIFRLNENQGICSRFPVRIMTNETKLFTQCLHRNYELMPISSQFC